MKIGLIPINVGVKSPDAMVALAKTAEEVGIESVWTFEHAMVPVEYESKYPYSGDGKMGAQPETHMIDPLIALACVAAHTSRLKLGTGINILPQANPLYLAKQVASLDFLSGGRFLFGVGVGWLEEEFRALGVPFERRGARFNDALVALKKVWSGDVVEHKSDFIDWSGFKSYPLPAQRPHPPIIIGGAKPKALERVVRHGDGWFAPSGNVEQLGEMIRDLRRVAEAHGRAMDSIEVSSMWIAAGEGIDSVKRYEDLGVSRLITPVQALGGWPPIDALRRFGDDVLAKL